MMDAMMQVGHMTKLTKGNVGYGIHEDIVGFPTIDAGYHHINVYSHISKTIYDDII